MLFGLLFVVFGIVMVFEILEAFSLVIKDFSKMKITKQFR